jgi:hypothetical protein
LTQLREHRADIRLGSAAVREEAGRVHQASTGWSGKAEQNFAETQDSFSALVIHMATL